MNIKTFFFILFLLCLTVECKKENYDISDPGYAIGEISGYDAAIWTKNYATIRYYFRVEGKSIHNYYNTGEWGFDVPKHGNYSIGDKYIIQYSISNPDCTQCNRMLFDYPVKDSADYVKYITFF